MSPRLTKKQRALFDEVDEVFSILGLDYFRILASCSTTRSDVLELAKRHAIRSEVITQHTLIDERLSSVLCDYFFGRHRDYIKLWKTKKFRHFNHYVLQELGLVKKLVFVKEILDVPRPIVNDIEKINGIRNALAHAFFPENLRKRRLQYEGIDIFSAGGIRRILEDTSTIYRYFDRKRYFY